MKTAHRALAKTAYDDVSYTVNLSAAPFLAQQKFTISSLQLRFQGKTPLYSHN